MGPVTMMCRFKYRARACVDDQSWSTGGSARCCFMSAEWLSCMKSLLGSQVPPGTGTSAFPFLQQGIPGGNFQFLGPLSPQ